MFFRCSDAPRDLHSFPTRRSSDLNDPCHYGEHRHKCNEQQAALAKSTVVLKARHARREEDCRYQDRKSTRLNSSHTVISYAVFCLKKKIQQDSSSRIVTYPAPEFR